jgi:hypothetical protein
MADGYFNKSINDSDNSVQTGTATPINVNAGTAVVLVDAAIGGVSSVVLPNAAASVGDVIHVANQGGGVATVSAAGGSTVVGTATVADDSAGAFVSDGVSAWVRVLIA